MEILRITFIAEGEYRMYESIVWQWCVWRAGRGREWQWHTPGLFWLSVVCAVWVHPIPSAIPGLEHWMLHTDKVHNAHTVCYSNPTEPESKETWCAHLLVIELYALAVFQQRSPPLYSGSDGHVKNGDFFFFLFFSPPSSLTASNGR